MSTLRKQFEAFDKDIYLDFEGNEDSCFNFYDWFCKDTSLKNKAAKRQELIQTLQEELLLSEKNVHQVEQQVDSLEKKRQELTLINGRILRQMYREKQRSPWLALLLSANNGNQLALRLRYFYQFRQYRNEQWNKLKSTLKVLTLKQEELKTEKETKSKLVQVASTQQTLLIQEAQASNKLASTLKAEENKLVAALQEQEKQRLALDASIQSLIQREIAAREAKAAAEAAARAKAATKTSTKPGFTAVSVEKRETESVTTARLTAENSPASSSFASMQGKLPWPVRRGTITKPFGRQKHPTLPKVEIANNGIDIETPGPDEVLAVAAGEVVGIQQVPGYQNLILLRHGKYYTVYSNVQQVSVTRGAEVSAGAVLGTLGSQSPLLHFEIWEGKNLSNPSKWISKK